MDNNDEFVALTQPLGSALINYTPGHFKNAFCFVIGELPEYATLQGRTPRWVAPELAGYGYEIAVLTKKPEPWAANLVGWAINAEIQNDVEMLERVQEIGAVTVQELSLGDGNSADVLIAKAAAPLPTSFDLPNGKMNLLVITRITRAEMELALKEGQHTLLERLAKAGVGQISDLDRKSIV